METQIGGNSVEVTDEGYLKDINQWSREVAIGIAEKVMKEELSDEKKQIALIEKMLDDATLN